MGKLGKPQKSKKHKKVLPFDSSLEGDRKSFRQDKDANRPPKNEEQEIPRKVQFFIDRKGSFQKQTQKQRKNRKHQQNDIKDHTEKGMTRPMKPAPKFVQRRSESDRKFLSRVDRETQSVILTSKLSDKYKVDFDELQQGNVTKKKKQANGTKLKRLKEKKTYKKEKKKEQKMEKKGDFSYLSDKIEFGEVAMAPPSLKTKPRKAPGSKDAIPRPGKKSLLLKEIITDNTNQNSGKGVLSSTREVGQTLKRKQMSLSQQHKLDHERDRAIKMYRQLKDKQNKTPS